MLDAKRRNTALIKDHPVPKKTCEERHRKDDGIEAPGDKTQCPKFDFVVALP
ncbi:hypothetical protein [Rhizobium sp. L245/93]|uniref:hypothetical protein n=1 Tax=Rhizobium sp. L245/93 TaxID=2819998 RepID=UPI001ADD2CF6|nr:hypothetical protein [Rhizobium sp. L245/93]MBO9170908.1 hypothetical protein [Rhizobium sp. L245/93]